jgi:carbamoyl-phosphate synthase large subunit
MPAKRKTRLRVLFTSAGRRVELLRAFKQAFATLGLPGDITAVDINPLAAALQIADHHVIVPRLNDPSYADIITDLCRRREIDMVFPLIDPDIPVLAAMSDRLAAVGTHVATVPLASVETVQDKWKTTCLFRNLSLPTPRSWLPDDPPMDTGAYPVFIKPRTGSSSANAFAVRDADELAFFQKYVPHAIVQEYLPGPEVTSDVICDQRGDVMSVVSRKRIEVRSGEVTKGVTCVDAGIIDACCRVAKALHARGPITVQGLYRNDDFYFTEVNARLGGGVPLAIAAGARVAEWLLASAARLPVDLPPLGSYESGVFLTRFDDSFFFTTQPNGSLQSRHL